MSGALEEGSPAPQSEQPVSCLKAQVAAILLKLFMWHKIPVCAYRVTFCLQSEPSSHIVSSAILGNASCSAQPPLPSDLVPHLYQNGQFFYLKPALVSAALCSWCGSCFSCAPLSFTLAVWSVSPPCLAFLRSWSQAEMGGHLLSVSKIF